MWEVISDLPFLMEYGLSGFLFILLFCALLLYFSSHCVSSPEKPRGNRACLSKIYYRKLVHMIMEAEKSHSFLCVSQRPESWLSEFSFRAENQCCSSSLNWGDVGHPLFYFITNSNSNLIWKHSHRHTQIQWLARYLDALCEQVSTLN